MQKKSTAILLTCLLYLPVAARADSFTDSINQAAQDLAAYALKNRENNWDNAPAGTGTSSDPVAYSQHVVIQNNTSDATGVARNSKSFQNDFECVYLQHGMMGTPDPATGNFNADFTPRDINDPSPDKCRQSY